MNLAIPIELLYEIEAELIRFGRVMSRKPRTWTGIYHAPFQTGVMVVEVMPDAPAHKAGLQKGDIITHIEGNRVKSEEQFLRRLWEIPIGREFQITFWRQNTEETLIIKGMDFYEFYDVSGSTGFQGH